jgi:hypothetical protein
MRENDKIKEDFAVTLWFAFANQEFCDEQSPQVFWAIEEGGYRAGLLPYHYSTPTARKEHECIRGCKIPVGAQYFKSADTRLGIKICARCMAMILYFKQVGNLATYKYDYWEKEKNKPHFDQNGKFWEELQVIPKD